MSRDFHGVRERARPDADTSVFGLAPLLWPEPAAVTLHGGGAPPARGGSLARYLPLPSPADPRMLVPLRPRRVAASAIRHQPAATPKARLRRDLAALGLAAGLGDIAMRRHLVVSAADPAADTIEGFFRRHLGHEVLLSVALGKPRANRKPVIGVLSPSGEMVGFAKVGVDPLTNSLVRAETQALHTIAAADLRVVTAADLLLAQQWNSCEIVMTRPLPVWQRHRAVPTDRLVAAIREVAAVVPPSAMTLRDWARESGLRDRLAGLAEGEAGTDLRSAMADLLATSGDLPLVCGSWHGDWTPWNMAWATEDRLLVWDWERFTAPAPIGFDALHYRLQTALVSQRQAPQGAAEDLVRDGPALLATYGVAAADAPVVVAGYLVELACRYLHDGQEEAGARLGRVGDWLVPVVARLAARP